MRLTPKQRAVIKFMESRKEPVTVRVLSDWFMDAQRSMYGKRLKSLERKGLVRQHYYKGPWSLIK